MSTGPASSPAKPAKSKKEKEKKQLQQSNERLKTVIRRLPPTLPEEIFWESVHPWVTEETTLWKAYYPGKPGKKLNKENISSRAYIAFKNEEQLALFSRHYDGHTFRDKNGAESQAVVEFAPYQKIPTEKKKPDNRNGTIEKDEDFISFVEALKAAENAEPVSLENLIASTQPAPPPKTTPLLEALKAEKSAAKDKEAILRNHAHYKQAEASARKEEKKKASAAVQSRAEGPAPNAHAAKKAGKKAHTQTQAQAQATAAAAVQAAASPTTKVTKVNPPGPQNQKGVSNVSAGGSTQAARPPKPPRPNRGGQQGKGGAPPAGTASSTTTVAPAIMVNNGSTPAPSQAEPQSPTPRRARPVIGIASRQFEAALSIAGLANSASERKRREKEGPGSKGADNLAGGSSNRGDGPAGPSNPVPMARIDGSDTEIEKTGTALPPPSPRKDRPKRGGRAGGGGGGGGPSLSDAASKVPSILQRNDGPPASGPVIAQRPSSSNLNPSSVPNSQSPPAGGGSGPRGGRKGRGGGRGRGGPPGGPRGGG